MKLTLLRKGLLLVSIPLCFEITIFGVLLHMQDQIEREAERVNRNKQITALVNGIVHDLVKATDLFEYRQPVDSREYSFPPSIFNQTTSIKKLMASARKRTKQIQDLAQDDPVLLKRVNACTEGLTKGQLDLVEMGQRVATASGDDVQPILKLYRRKLNADLHESFGHGLLELGEYTEKETEDLASAKLRDRIRIVLKVALGFSVLFALFCAAIFSKHLVGRLSLVADNADKLAKGEPLLEPIGGTDEVAELDKHLHYAAKLIDEARRMRQEVTAMITHDLKSPLQSVRSFLEMLDGGLFGELNEKGKKLLGTTESASMHMVGLIDSVLQLEKVRTGKIELNKTLVELAPLIRKSIDSVNAYAEGKSISIVTDLTSDECDVSADEFWLQEIFVNLLSNAIKYSPNNTTVRVTSQVVEKNVEIAVVDEGPGIPDKEINLIFERFHRVKGTENISGTGLGLPIAKELVEMHEGTIKVESDGIKGSAFIITLPIWRAAPSSLD